MIIDSHVYCLPPRLRDHAVRLPASEAPIRSAIHRHPDGHWVLPLSSPESILRSMDKAGVDRAVLVSFPWADPSLCSENNDFTLLQARNRRFWAVCSVQPFKPGWDREARRCLAAGAVGIKVNPSWQGGSLDDPAVLRLASLVEEQGAFLLVHTDQLFRDSRSSPARLLELARRRPETRIVAAHMGGLLGLYADLARIKPCIKNLWFDTAVSETMRMVSWYADAGLTNRLLFGTDYPFNGCHSQAKVVERLRKLRLGRTAEAGVFGGNLLKLLGPAGKRP
ncbi:MAG: amidohydrolase family protein [Elusimicrobiota bacterium]|jgi:hypothetical protein